MFLFFHAQDLHTHETAECEARLISCPSGCESDNGEGATTLFPARALDVHLKHDCGFRLVKCAACGNEVTARQLDAHKQNTCRFVSALLRGYIGTRLWYREMLSMISLGATEQSVRPSKKSLSPFCRNLDLWILSRVASAS